MWALLLIVHTWNSSPLRSNLLRLQCTCTVPTTSGRPHGSPLVWVCQWPSNSLWQGWSCRLVHYPGGNATDPIWRVLASSQGISSWNFNIVTLTLWPINSGVLTSLLLSHLSSSLTDSLPSLNLLCHSKTDARFMQDGPKAVWSIRYISVAFFSSLKQNFIAYRS